MAGFNSPNILFLNTYDSLDRKYVRELAPKLLDAGFDRYAELYCGAFVMPLVMADAGWKPEQMHCYDVSLYSSILGYVFSGKPLDYLNVMKNGELIELDRPTVHENAALLLYEQALARMDSGSEIEYYRMILEDLQERNEQHIAYIAARIKRMDEALHGLHFERLYLWDAFELEKDRAETFICSNPPTYKGAYENFFDTGGIIEWDAIDYEVWNGSVDCPKLAQAAKEVPATLLFLQQADKGKAATVSPVSARYLSETQNVYYNTNHSEIIEGLMGKKAETQRSIATVKSKYPILPDDYEITRDTKLTVVLADTKEAEYYRGLWLHRIRGKSVTVNLCVLADGMICGYIGLDLNAIIKPYNNATDKAVILSYAVPAPNKKQRLARLLVSIAKSKKILGDALAATQSAAYIAAAESICTVEYSRHCEVKGLRGLMKIKNKSKQGEVNALVYSAPLNQQGLKQIKAEFVDKEAAYKEKTCRTKE